MPPPSLAWPSPHSSDYADFRTRCPQREELTMTTQLQADQLDSSQLVPVRIVDSDVHPTPKRGELDQFVPAQFRKLFAQRAAGAGDSDLLRRTGLPQRVRDAHRHLPRRRQFCRLRPRPVLPPADHGRRFGHRDPRPAERIRRPDRGRNPRTDGRDQPLAGRLLARQRAQLAPAFPRLYRRGHRGPGGMLRARSRPGPVTRTSARC